MINSIIRFAVRERLLVILGTLILIGFGLFAVKRIPIDAFPDVTNVQVQVLYAHETDRFFCVPLALCCHL